MVVILKFVADGLGHSEGRRSHFGMVIRYGVGASVSMRQEPSVAKAEAVDIGSTGVGRHPSEGRGRHVVNVEEDLAIDPGKWSVGSARPQAACMNGINAGFAIALEGRARAGDDGGLQDGPSFSSGNVSDKLGGGAPGNGDNVVVVVEHDKRPPEAGGIRVVAVPAGAIGVDSPANVSVETGLLQDPFEGALRRRLMFWIQLQDVEGKEPRGKSIADLPWQRVLSRQAESIQNGRAVLGAQRGEAWAIKDTVLQGAFGASGRPIAAPMQGR